MLVTKKTQEYFLLLFIYTVESEDANYWQMKKEVSLRKGTDETRLAQRSFSWLMKLETSTLHFACLKFPIYIK